MNPEILESLEETREELKRADHMLFVTLKYTRTAEVIKNIIFRLINTYARGIDTLLEYALDQNKISQIPVPIQLKTNLVLEVFPSRELESHVNLYKILRMAYKADYTTREEFRRNLTLIPFISKDLLIEINMDNLYQYFLKAEKFIELIKEIIYG